MRALLLGLLGLSAASCKVSHQPPSHRTPMDTVRTFQTAFAHDDLEQEYRCLSESMKRGAAGQEGYVLVRDRVFEPLGGLGRWVLRRNDLDDNLCGALDGDDEVVLGFTIFGEGFGIGLVREDRLQIHLRGEDEPIEGLPRMRAQGELWRLSIELAAPEVARLESAEVESLQLLARWKISSLQQPPPEFSDDVDARAIAERGAETGEELVGPAPWTRGEEDLGVVPVEFRLPRPPRPRARPITWTPAEG